MLVFFASFYREKSMKKVPGKISLPILAAKTREGARRKKEYPNHPNEKFLGVQNPFFKKGFGRRRQSCKYNPNYYI
jgi:hypothetical protein